ncbi:MFS transporter [Dactylosporangium aurantiacum]|uniref:MFS transporter n=1 Tax=Dactylosporangium aurantiacum TaxID=35754 RepID=UPI001FE00F15|nr:MFS transporter [Dactylosporangium aurantiacum]MDG6107770.1 MFS transporter [Dactylosporangium aurantiacum]
MPESSQRRVLVRARVATALLFLLFGITLGAWTARIPAVKRDLALDDGALSLALLAFAAGAITGMQATGRLVDRFGSRRVMLPAAFAEGLALILPAYAPDLAALAVALFVFGAVHGTLNIAMNANAIDVQRSWQRPIMSSFHAVYSIGGFLGASAGGLFAHAGAGPRATFAAVGGAMLAFAAWSSWWALPPAPAPAVLSTPVAAPAGPVRGVLFLGVLACCALVGEGAAADWSAVYLRDDLHSSAGFAAAAFAAFSVAMTVTRLAGDRLTARFGPVLLVRASGLLAAGGLGAALLAGEPAAGVAGFACLGAGMALIAPQVYSAAGDRNPDAAGRALARVVGLGYLGFLLGPVLIGAASRVAGLPGALAIPVLLSLFVAATATALRPTGRRGAHQELRTPSNAPGTSNTL